jgi:hypothetical protein
VPLLNFMQEKTSLSPLPLGTDEGLFLFY